MMNISICQVGAADQCIQHMIQSSGTLVEIYSVECISMYCLGRGVVPNPRNRRVLTIPEC